MAKTKRRPKLIEWFSGYAPNLMPIPGLMVYAQARITPLHYESIGEPCWSLLVQLEGGHVQHVATAVPACADLGVAWEPETPPVHVAAGWCTAGKGGRDWEGVDALCRIIPDPRLPVGERNRRYGSSQKPAWSLPIDRAHEIDRPYCGFPLPSEFYVNPEVFNA